MRCSGSQTVRYVSDAHVVLKKSKCPLCGQDIKISIPDPKMHGNTAKFAIHSVTKK